MLHLSATVLQRACLGIALFGSAIGTLQAAVCRVTPGSAASGNGGDWGAQAMRLPAALADTNCTEIWVQQGLYKPVTPAAATPTPAERAVGFAINRPLQLYGGFFGDETTRDQRHATAPSVLSGDIDNNDTNLDGNHIAEVAADNLGANSFHVLVIGGVGAAANGTYTPANTVLDGFVVTAGRAAEGVEPHNTRGGGLFCNGEGANCSPRLNRLTFSGNLAVRGGAIYNNGYVGASNPRIENATFSGNTASQFGGAIHNYGFAGQSSPTITNTTFSDNHSDNDGGAIYSNGGFGASFPTLSFVTASGNTADDCGGAIFNFNEASIVVHRSILWGNTSAFLPGSEICNNNDGLSTIINSIAASGCVPGDTCIVADPALGPLQDNGGATYTRLPGAGSAAIDAATACTDAANAPLAADQRGVPRSQAAQCDLGAVESRHYTLDVIATGPGSVSVANPPAPIAGIIAACTFDSGSCSAVYPEGFAVPLQAAGNLGYRPEANGCGGTLAGSLFTTAPLSGNCSVGVSFVRNPLGTIAFGTLAAIDAPEGNGGTRTLSIPLTLSEPTAESVTLAYTLAPANGGAGTVASDFTTAATGSVSFPPGAQDATLTLDIAAEDVVEPDEAFALSFALTSTLPPTSDANATLASDVAAGLAPTLRNDDSAVLTLADASASENAGTLQLPWTLSAPVQGGFGLLYATGDGTAVAGIDYTATAGELLHDGSTTTAYAIAVPVLDDDAFEPQETFSAQIGPPTCTFSPCDLAVNDATGAIDDDEAPLAGLAVTVDNHVDASDPGDVVTYRVAVSHRGSTPAIGVTLADGMPAALQDATWTCSATAGGSCSASDGVGPLALGVDLPDGAQALLEVTATVGAFDPTLDYTVTLTPPAGYDDPEPSDNSATDSDVIRSVFGDEFE